MFSYSLHDKFFLQGKIEGREWEMGDGASRQGEESHVVIDQT